MIDKISVLGEGVETGAYLLRILVNDDLIMHFGQFQRGRLINVPRGEYLYIGSAMARRGSMTLARRLLRHATRRDQAHPHAIRGPLLMALKSASLGPDNLHPPPKKKLFWNIDFLLEQKAANLTQVIIQRSRVYLEDQIAQYLWKQEGISALVTGLGAQDKRGQTHLLAVNQSEAWWHMLPISLSKL